MVCLGEIDGTDLSDLGVFGRSTPDASTAEEAPVGLTTQQFRRHFLESLSPVPEGIPEPMGHGTYVSILACHNLGQGRHVCMPGDGCADGLRHGT